MVHRIMFVYLDFSRGDQSKIDACGELMLEAHTIIIWIYKVYIRKGYICEGISPENTTWTNLQDLKWYLFMVMDSGEFDSSQVM